MTAVCHDFLEVSTKFYFNRFSIVHENRRRVTSRHLSVIMLLKIDIISIYVQHFTIDIIYNHLIN